MAIYTFSCVAEMDRAQFSLKENEAIFPHPLYGDFARSFFPYAQAGKFEDISFCILQNSTPIALVDCTFNQEKLSYFGFPIRVLWATTDENIQAKASSALVEKLSDIAREKKINSISITGDDDNHKLGPLGKACLDAGASPKHHFHAIADLSQTEEELRKDLRKSYKSLINWGQKNILLRTINASNPDRNSFNGYVEFYGQVAKKQPHATAVWDKLYESIAEGRGELTLGYSNANQEMIAGNIIIEENQTAYYFLGAYDREKFEHPIGHWPLFASMINAKSRNNQRFDLGEFFSQSHKNTKEVSIGFFKKGFTQKSVSYTSWQLTL